jgi:hypothetical protein
VRLKTAAAIDAVLETELRHLLSPPKGAAVTFRRQQAAWKRRAQKEAVEQANAKQRAKVILSRRVATIRELGQQGKVSGDHRYLVIG